MSDALVPSAEPLATAREHAIRLLTDRYADDSLTTGEFEARLDRLYATAAPPDVERLVADLHVARPRPAPVPMATAAVPVAAPAAPPYQAPYRPFGAATRRLLCVLGQRTIAGRWAAPERLEVRCVLSEVVLDLRDAELPDASEIDVACVLGKVQLLLPPHAEVESQIGAVLGSVTDRTVTEGSWPTARTPVRVRLVGTSVLGEVEVRRVPPGLPTRLPFRKAWKAGRSGTQC